MLIQNQINEFTSNLRKILEGLEGWEDRLREHWSNVAQYGWFPNWETSINLTTALSKGHSALDTFMIQHIEESWDILTRKILELCPDRSHILNVAFSLHKERNYIASIPLLMAQADGVSAQHLGAFLFSEHDRRRKSINHIAEDSGDILLTALLNVLGVNTQFGAGIRTASNNKKQLAPNRNGVLHGAREHLDYGTKINSFKTFSLLAFVVMVLTDRDTSSSGKKI